MSKKRNESVGRGHELANALYDRTAKWCGLILLHGNARSHASNQMKHDLSDLNFEVLPFKRILIYFVPCSAFSQIKLACTQSNDLYNIDRNLSHFHKIF